MVNGKIENHRARTSSSFLSKVTLSPGLSLGREIARNTLHRDTRSGFPVKLKKRGERATGGTDKECAQRKNGGPVGGEWFIGFGERGVRGLPEATTDNQREGAPGGTSRFTDKKKSIGQRRSFPEDPKAKRRHTGRSGDSERGGAKLRWRLE